MKRGLILLIFTAIFGCQQSHPLQKEYPGKVSLKVQNPAMTDRKDALVTISLISLPADFNAAAFVVVDRDNELPGQATDLDGDGMADQISFLCDLEALGSKDISILYAAEGSKKRPYEKRTQAEISRKTGGEWVEREYVGGTFENVDYLRVPDEHTDHSWFIRYEGPGWESDKVGYRFYLDWRNALDIFGKKTSHMVLQDVGQDDFDSYHEMSDWGMDVLKVGGSLGIGSVAMWVADSAQRVERTDSVSCRIVSNGVIQSSVETNYFGWQVNGQNYDLSTLLTINAGSRLTRCDLRLDSNPENLCSGIAKHDSAEVILSNNKNSTWQYLANYGRQTLNNDKLGMAVLYMKDDLIKLADDRHNHAVILKPENGMLTYYFLAAWELEPGGISSREAFIKYLDDTLARLDKPVLYTIN